MPEWFGLTRCRNLPCRVMQTLAYVICLPTWMIRKMWRSIGAWSASLCENRTLGSRIISRIGLTSERANNSRFYQSRVAFLSFFFLFFFFLGEIEVHLHRSRVTTGILSCSSLGQTRCFTHTFPVSCPLDFAGRACVCVCVSPTCI